MNVTDRLLDLDQAKAVTFNKEIRTRSVTLLGDVFDPAGTLSGGSRTTNKSILLQIQELNNAKAELKKHERKLAEINNKIAELQSQLGEFKKLKQEYEIKSHEVDLLEARLNQTTHQQHAMKLKELEETIVESEKAIAAAQKKVSFAKTADVDNLLRRRILSRNLRN